MEGVDNRGTNKLYPRKKPVFLTEKYIEDVRQDEKHVSDLLEAIMRPKLFVKAELRPILFKIDQFRHEITKIPVGPKS